MIERRGEGSGLPFFYLTSAVAKPALFVMVTLLGLFFILSTVVVEAPVEALKTVFPVFFFPSIVIVGFFPNSSPVTVSVVPLNVASNILRRFHGERARLARPVATVFD